MESKAFFKSLADAFVVVGASSQQQLEPLAPEEGSSAVRYKPAVLDTLPESMSSSNTVRDLALFCMPRGVELAESYGEPSAFSLVLTDELGRRCYATCLSYFDNLDTEQKAHGSDRLRSGSVQPPQRPGGVRDDKDGAEDATKLGRRFRGKKPLRKALSMQSSTALPSVHSSQSIAEETFLRNASPGRDEELEETESIAFPFLEPEHEEHVGHPLGPLGTDLSSQLRLKEETRIMSSVSLPFVNKDLLDEDAPSDVKEGEQVAPSSSVGALPVSMSLGNLPDVNRRAILHDSHLTFNSEAEEDSSEDEGDDDGFVVVHARYRKPKRNLTLPGRMKGKQIAKALSQASSTASRSLVSNQKKVTLRTMPKRAVSYLAPTKASESQNASSLYATKCICIMSRFPLFSTFKAFLEQIYHYVGRTNGLPSVPIERYITALLTEVPLPPLGSTVQFCFHGPLAPLPLPRRPLRGLPHLDVPLRVLFSCLDEQNVVTVLCAALLEKKILLLASDTSLLGVVGEGISSLMYPFSWDHVYIPALPHALAECTDAPTPFIMGLDRRYRSWVDDFSQLVVVDLDRNTVQCAEMDPLPALPETLVEDLLVDLREHVHPNLRAVSAVSYPKKRMTQEEMETEEEEHMKKVRMLFLRFFVMLFGTFRTFINDEKSSGSFFHQQQFLSAQPRESQEFLDQFLDTQAFQIFIEKQVTGDDKEYCLFNDMAERVQQGEKMDTIFPLYAERSSSFSSLSRKRTFSASPKSRTSASDTNVSVTVGGGDAQLPSISRSRSIGATEVATTSAPDLLSQARPSFEELKRQEALVKNPLEVHALDPAQACMDAMDLHMWSPFTLPEISDIRSGPGPRFEELLVTIDNTISVHSDEPQLHLFRAQVLTAMYQATDCEDDERTDDDHEDDTLLGSDSLSLSGHKTSGDSGLLFEAMLSYSRACCLDSLYFDPLVAQPVLDQLPGKLLKLLASQEVFEGLKELTKERIFSREDALNPSEGSISSSEVQGESGASNAGDSCNSPDTLRASHDWLSVDSPSPSISVSIPSKGLAPNAFKSLAREYLLVFSDEDASRLADCLLKVSKKTGIVSARAINGLLHSLKVARLEVNTWCHNFRDDLNSSEKLVFSSKACTFDGRKGNLILTDSRLVFVRKGKRTRGIPLSSIQSLRSFNYHIFVPPGLPCLKIFMHDQPKPFIFSFAHFSGRDLWYLNIREMLAAVKMTADLRDRRILKQARHNVFLSQVLAKDKAKSLFHFFGKNFPLEGWFRFSTLLQRHGFLNTEVVQETPMEDPMMELEGLMRFVVELFFEYVNADGKSVDFEALTASPRWVTFNEAVCQLQMFDLQALAVQQRLVAIAQIYNMLVVHAFVLHGGFPSNLWDWRYFERKTYYTIGGVAYSIGDLHHGVLRGNRVAPWDSEPMFAPSDPRSAFHAEEAELRDPRMLFVLAMHNGMSPAMFTLQPEHMDHCLQRATEFFCQEHVEINKTTITLPRLLDWYREDMGGSDENLLRFVNDFLTPGKQKAVLRMLASGQFNLVWREDWAPCPRPLFSVNCS